MHERIDVGYGDIRAIRDGIAYDEGRASARLGLRSTTNPFRKDVEPDRHHAWVEGYSSYNPVNGIPRVADFQSAPSLESMT